MTTRLRTKAELEQVLGELEPGGEEGGIEAEGLALVGRSKTFYDFPAEHWIHLRTTNPIESTFDTVRHRHRKTKGSGSRKACLTMVFKLMQLAEKHWRKLNAVPQILHLLAGYEFVDGIMQERAA